MSSEGFYEMPRLCDLQARVQQQGPLPCPRGPLVRELRPHKGFCGEGYTALDFVICHGFRAWNLSFELFYAIPNVCQKKKEQLPKSRHFPISKNKMLAML